MKGPTPRRLHDYLTRRLRLGCYLREPGDGRSFPQRSAASLVWALLLGKVLRVPSFYGVEMLSRQSARGMGVPRPFGDDTLAYFTERLDPGPTRRALVDVVRRAKRNKAFETQAWIGLAVDGSGAGSSAKQRCELCHKQGAAYGHKLAAISVVGAGLDLPFDVEFYGPGENELIGAKRLLERALGHLGPRFADYLVVDGLYNGAPFLHLTEDLGVPVIAALKDNLPELSAAARRRFENRPPMQRFDHARGVVEVWDADDFITWHELRWPRVRVLRYRHVRADGEVFDAYWLTNLSMRRVGSRALFHMAKSRWAIENHGFNDAKNRYGLAHIPHHHPASVLADTLLTFLAICVERLYRLRYLCRGTHKPYSAIELCRLLWLNLAHDKPYDTS
ncbi:MAG: transposase [Gemmatimonadota bacterium]